MIPVLPVERNGKKILAAGIRLQFLNIPVTVSISKSSPQPQPIIIPNWFFCPKDI